MPRVHSAYMVVGVLPAHQGRGLGAALLAALDRWAVLKGECGVVADSVHPRRPIEEGGAPPRPKRTWRSADRTGARSTARWSQGREANCLSNHSISSPIALIEDTD